MRDNDPLGYWAERAGVDNDAPLLPPTSFQQAFGWRATLAASEAAMTPEEKEIRKQRTEKIFDDFEAWARTQHRDYRP